MSEICIWEETDEDGYDTSCGYSFIFTSGGPREDSKISFCIYCGKLIKFEYQEDDPLV